MLLSTFLPTLLFSIGEGAIIPLLPAVAGDLGATLALAGLVAGMIMIGELAGDIPSGWIVSRIGERGAMLSASAASILGLVVCLVATSWVGLTLGVFVIGLATAVFALARHAFMTSFVPISHRARALSALAGAFRAGWLIGPFLAAGVVHLTGSLESVFWVHILCCVAAVVVLVLVPDPATVLRRARTTDAVALDAAPVPESAQSLLGTLREHRGVLVRMGSGAAVIGALRASRTLILPLWAVSIGLAGTETAIIIGVAGALDFALFYAGGQLMDRFGRGATAIPSMIGLGLGHLALAASVLAADPVPWFVAVACVLAAANGIGSGILMTIGADLAPPADPAPFLGAFRFTGDAGNAAAPLVVSALTAAVSLPFAAVAVGVLGLAGAGALSRWIPRYLPRSAPRG
ncbi:MFS transporter [Rathayibacter iranicus]|uniref:MFS transporter n=1 Tax=Rathayibacter iranicus TaxID=59737 RepID=A0AAD1AFH3_9MICO|nr:MFS transporter [Rathayibacter iranicus]AZZ57259.1 MFS transporter [Rathayibacter iranicus]MWV30419.1 MFS transporter [Rathayibacter iranicus NCPPB 2253 = VKM Ac-1602]PPI51214.1 MFS transporter [Rathayibacter iranicus]PPI63482.1 MFS transporter [Rathayibacter iranicus]PPI74246.1 MFS transporter [Rathayibacter iranicus]